MPAFESGVSFVKFRLRSVLELCLLPVLGLVAFGAAQAATTSYYNTVFAFDRTTASGGVVLGTDGALYGTTSTSSYSTGGLIYRVTVDGANPQTIYQLSGDNGDGYAPSAALLLGSDGYLYGTTYYGPRLGSSTQNGSGTIFRIRQDGTEFTTLHVLAAATDTTNHINAEGMYPKTALIEGEDGYLYGTTSEGGQFGTGTIFRIAKSGGGFQSLHQFAALDSSSYNTEGAYPAGKLLIAADGRLYGVTSAGGATGYGTVYSLGIDGSGFEAIYEFSALDSDSKNSEGAQPVGALAETGNRILGVTQKGGSSTYGTVYALTTDGTAGNTELEVLHTFAGVSSGDGSTPQAGLIVSGDGRLYGTTTGGNADSNSTGYGTVFAITVDGSDYEILRSFDSSGGSTPNTELAQASNSETYFGTTSGGGACGYGTVYRLSVGPLASQQGDGHVSCESTDSGGGSMGGGLLLLLSMLGLAPTVRRNWDY